VLSPGTEAYDRGEKREHYEQVDSLREYVLVSQDKKRVELWSRSATSEACPYTVGGPGETVELRSIGCRLDVTELYATAGLALS